MSMARRWSLFTMNEAALEKLSTVDVPPILVVWLTAIVDTVTSWIGLEYKWRDWLSQADSEWFGYHQKVPYMMNHLPPLLSYQQFVEDEGEATMFSFSSMYKFAFETPSTTLSDLTSPTSLAVLFVLVVLMQSFKGVVLPIFVEMGRKAARQTHGKDWELVSENAIRIHKFGEYVYRLIYHSLISAYGLWYFHDKPWWQPGGTHTLHAGFPNHPIQPGMTWYYLIQAAYNIDAAVSLITLSVALRVQPLFTTTTPSTSNPTNGTNQQQAKSTRLQFPIVVEWSKTARGDFREMAIHHAATNMLIVCSSACRETRMGSMVFMVHDLSDIPVDGSKLANFVKWKTATIVCFVTMCLVWIVTRLTIFPFVIYRSLLVESHHCLDEGLPPLLFVCWQPVFVLLLPILILLHVFWFYAFLRMAYTLVTKFECHDYSEHRQGENHDSTDKNKVGASSNKTNGSSSENGSASTMDEKKRI